MSKSQVLYGRVVCDLHHIYPVDKPVDNFCRKFFRGSILKNFFINYELQ